MTGKDVKKREVTPPARRASAAQRAHRASRAINHAGRGWRRAPARARRRAHRWRPQPRGGAAHVRHAAPAGRQVRRCCARAAAPIARSRAATSLMLVLGRRACGEEVQIGALHSVRMHTTGSQSCVGPICSSRRPLAASVFWTVIRASKCCVWIVAAVPLQCLRWYGGGVAESTVVSASGGRAYVRVVSGHLDIVL